MSARLIGALTSEVTLFLRKNSCLLLLLNSLFADCASEAQRCLDISGGVILDDREHICGTSCLGHNSAIWLAHICGSVRTTSLRVLRTLDTAPGGEPQILALSWSRARGHYCSFETHRADAFVPWKILAENEWRREWGA